MVNINTTPAFSERKVIDKVRVYKIINRQGEVYLCELWGWATVGALVV